MLERRHDNDHISLVQRGTRNLRIEAVEFRFSVQQHISLARLYESLDGVRSLARYGVGQITADRVCGLGQIAELCIRILRDPLRSGMQLRGLRMLCRGVAKDNSFLLARQQTRRDTLGHFTRLGAFEAGRNRDAFGLCNGDDHFAQSGQPVRRSLDHPVCNRDRKVIVRRVQKTDGGTTPGCLAQACREQWMVLAQERADDECSVDLAEFFDRHAEPRHNLTVQREIGLAQAEVHVVRAEAANHLLQQGKFFERGVRCGQRGNRIGAVLLADTEQPARHILKSGLPVGFNPFAILLDHRNGQTLRAVQAFVCEAVLV